MSEGSGFDGCAVIFHNVLEWYKPSENVICLFSIKDKVSIDAEEQPDCYVAIFHVGWDSLEANITRKNFTMIETVSDKSFQIDFLEKELPAANPDEFYQFCFYNIKTEVVYGASCPFQICNRSDAEPFIVCSSSGSPRSEHNASGKNEMNTSMNTWVDENNIEITESEDDFTTVMVVKKDAQLMRDDLSKAKLQNEQLLKTNESMKTQTKQTVSEINRLNHDIDLGEKKTAILEENVRENEKVINHLNLQMKNMKEELIAEHERKVADLSREIEALESSRAKAHFDNNLLAAELKDLEQKYANEVAHLKNALEVEKNSCKLLEDEHGNILEKFGKIKDEHGKDLEEAKLIQLKLVEVESQIRIEKQKNATLLNDLEAQTESCEELKNLVEKKEADFQEIKNSLREELDVTKTQMQEHIDGLSKELVESKHNEQQLEQTNKVSQERMKELEPQIEEICRLKAEEIERLNSEIKRQAELLHESNTQVHDLQLQIDNKTNKILEMQSNFQEEKEQRELIMEDLRSKVEELQENQLEQVEESKSKSPKPSTMTKSEGSYYALQVAYNFIQKQLKQFKAENEELRKINRFNLPTDIIEIGVGADTDSVIKENSDLKLRLQFGKTAFETTFKECEKLKSELKTLKKSTTSKERNESTNKFEFVDLKEKKEALEFELEVVKGQLVTKDQNEEELLTQLQDRNNRVRQFEDNYKLAKIENELLKAQVSALLEGGATATIRRKFDPTQPENQTKKTEIAYPPSMVIERKKREHATKGPQEPPSRQMIPNREPNQPSAPTLSQVATNIDRQPVRPVPNHHLIGRGGGQGSSQQQGNVDRDSCISTSPTSVCPVCQFQFPNGFSEMAASNHVNDHFRDR